MTRHADYYQRVKQDPEKLEALRARRAKNQRERRARLNPCSQQACSQQEPQLLTTDPVKDAMDFFNEPVVSSDVVSNLGGKHAATVPPGDISLSPDQIMEAWREVWSR